MKIRNSSGKPLSGFMAQLKPNFFGLTLEKIPDTTINNQDSRDLKVNIAKGGNKDSNVPKAPLVLTVGFKTNVDIFYFNVPCMFHVLLVRRILLTENNFF